MDPATEGKLVMTLAELNLSVRATNCLESENIHTVRDLVSRSEDQLLEVRNFGETTLNEVREKLSDIGLRLGMRLAADSVEPLLTSTGAVATAAAAGRSFGYPFRIEIARPCDTEDEAANSAAIRITSGPCCAIWPAP